MLIFNNNNNNTITTPFCWDDDTLLPTINSATAHCYVLLINNNDSRLPH